MDDLLSFVNELCGWCFVCFQTCITILGAFNWNTLYTIYTKWWEQVIRILMHQDFEFSCRNLVFSFFQQWTLRMGILFFWRWSNNKKLYCYLPSYTAWSGYRKSKYCLIFPHSTVIFIFNSKWKKYYMAIWKVQTLFRILKTIWKTKYYSIRQLPDFKFVCEMILCCVLCYMSNIK